MNTGIIFGLLVMLGHGIGTAISKIPSKNIGSTRSVFYRNLTISAIALVFLPFFESSFSFRYLAVAIFTSIIGFFALDVFYKAIKKGKVGIIIPISDASSLITVLFAILFFKEAFSAEKMLSVFIIFFGVMLLTVNFSQLKKSILFENASGINLAFLCMILWGIMYFIYKIPVMHLGPLFSTFVLEFGIFCMSFMSLKKQKINVKISKSDLKYMFLVGIFGAIGIISYSFGVKYTAGVGIMSAMSMATPLVAALYARIAYKEKLSLQQALGAIIIVAGVIGLNIF